VFNDYRLVKNFLDKTIADYTVMVVGDVMLDRYYFGEVKRISPEAPVPVTRVTHEHSALGGAGNVAHNLALLGAKVLLAGIAGQDENRRRLDGLLADVGVGPAGLMSDDRPTTTKLRVLGGHQQMIRLDFEDNRPVSGKTADRLKKYIDQVIQDRQVHAVVVSDYAKGVCTTSLCQQLIKTCRERDIPLIIDPKDANWKKYAGVPVITPNLKELAEAAKTEAVNDDRVVKNLADKLRKRFNIDSIIVTRSEKGMSVVSADKAVHLSTYAQEVFDVSGAGDTVVALLGAALAAGISLVDAAHLANVAAGIVVGKLGTYAVKRAELVAAVEQLAVKEEER